MRDTLQILQEIKQSKKFYEGLNTSIEGCSCERCLVSRYRHIHDPELMDEGHIYWDYLKYCISKVVLDGLWLEFGVGRGATIDFIAENNNGKQITGFDSFEGLPEEWKLSDSLVYSKGKYSLSGTLPAVKNKNVKIEKGYFAETLSSFLFKNKQKAAFIHIDCDLYSSTLFVLNTLHNHNKLVAGTIILFDELYNYQYFEEHEFKAFKEFFSRTGLKYQWIAHTESPVVWNGNQAALIIE
jgi:hypothetical protein